MKVFDNVLGRNALQSLQKEIVMSNAFPWYKTQTTYDSKSSDVTDYSWFHPVSKEGEVVSQVYSLLYPILLCAFDKINEPVNNFIRLRLALQTPIGQRFVNDAHVDYGFEHKTALLYLNTCDGNTIVYNEVYDHKSQISPLDYLNNSLKNNLTTLREVEPIENRLAVFNGLHYHSSQRPINFPYRVILNINYN